MYTNEHPEKGEIRYLTFRSYEGVPSLAKVETLRKWYDKDNESWVAEIKVIDSYFGEFKDGTKTNIDYPWELQKTIQDAKRVMIMATFKGIDAFVYPDPPWE